MASREATQKEQAEKRQGPYKNVAIRPPTIGQLSEIAESLGFKLDDAELAGMSEHISGLVKSYESLDEMVAPTLPVKYPRLPGFRPEPSENKYNAWYWKCDIAGAADGLLKGKTVAVKDNICVAGVPMTNGSVIMDKFVPDIDATVVTRILDAGGRLVGKTNCEHMCFSGSSWTNDTGPTLNPHDTTRSSGGSSGGSAVVVSQGEVDMAIGGDQGGSIRIPSSWCGIVGLKPTWGLVPYTGAVQIETTCDHLGPMTRTVADCALLLEAIAGRDEDRDFRQPRDLQVPKYTQLLTGNIKGQRIGLVKEGFNHCEEEVQRVVREAAQRLTEAGAIVEEFSMPEHTKAADVWTVVCVEGAYQCMVKGNAAGYHYKGYYSTAILDKLRTGYMTKANNLSEPMKLLMLFGEYVSKNYGNKFYAKGQNLTMKVTEQYNKVLETYDVLIMPTLPYKAPELPQKDWTVHERLSNALGMVKNTGPFDVTGHPALTINAGFIGKLPIGMMIVGKQFDDLGVMQVARAFEKIRDDQ